MHDFRCISYFTFNPILFLIVSDLWQVLADAQSTAFRAERVHSIDSASCSSLSARKLCGPSRRLLQAHWPTSWSHNLCQPARPTLVLLGWRLHLLSNDLILNGRLALMFRMEVFGGSLLDGFSCRYNTYAMTMSLVHWRAGWKLLSVTPYIAVYMCSSSD